VAAIDGTLLYALGADAASRLPAASRKLLGDLNDDGGVRDELEIAARIFLYSFAARLKPEDATFLERARKLVHALPKLTAVSDQVARGKLCVGLVELYLVTGDLVFLEATDSSVKESDDKSSLMRNHLSALRCSVARFSATGGRVDVDAAARLARSMLIPHVNDSVFSTTSLIERLEAARLLAIIYNETGDSTFLDWAKATYDHVLARYKRHVADSDSGEMAARLLMAFQAINSKPSRFAVVGSPDQDEEAKLWEAGLAIPDCFLRRIRWDPFGQDPVPFNTGYPRLKRPAAYLCVDGKCSLPQFSRAELLLKIKEVYGSRVGYR